MTKTLVIGDVHGCSAELEKLLRQVPADRIILVGDLFTKGPDPAGVWHLIQKYGMESVIGNHDEWILRIRDGLVPAKPKHLKVLNELEHYASGWEAWTRQLPLFMSVYDYTVVHAGLHPNGRWEDTTNPMALLMRRWPMDDPQALHWHEQYHGTQGVIFGHDAKQGLVFKRKNGKPFIVGLDTGCVYGNQLTGWVIETDELVQIQAEQVYQPISGDE